MEHTEKKDGYSISLCTPCPPCLRGSHPPATRDPIHHRSLLPEPQGNGIRRGFTTEARRARRPRRKNFYRDRNHGGTESTEATERENLSFSLCSPCPPCLRGSHPPDTWDLQKSSSIHHRPLTHRNHTEALSGEVLPRRHGVHGEKNCFSISPWPPCSPCLRGAHPPDT